MPLRPSVCDFAARLLQEKASSRRAEVFCFLYEVKRVSLCSVVLRGESRLVLEVDSQGLHATLLSVIEGGGAPGEPGRPAPAQPCCHQGASHPPHVFPPSDPQGPSCRRGLSLTPIPSMLSCQSLGTGEGEEKQIFRALVCPSTGPGGQAGGPGVQSQVRRLHRGLLPTQG